MLGKLLNRILITGFVGVATAVAGSSCTRSPTQQAAAIPADQRSEHIQLKLGNVLAYSNVTLDAELSPEGSADSLAGPLATLASSILKFCQPLKEPVQARFRLANQRKEDVVSTNDLQTARCIARNLEDATFPALPGEFQIVFRLNADKIGSPSADSKL